jgi:hypothetical protein
VPGVLPKPAATILPANTLNAQSGPQLQATAAAACKTYGSVKLGGDFWQPASIGYKNSFSAFGVPMVVDIGFTAIGSTVSARATRCGKDWSAQVDLYAHSKVSSYLGVNSQLLNNIVAVATQQKISTDPDGWSYFTRNLPTGTKQYRWKLESGIRAEVAGYITSSLSTTIPTKWWHKNTGGDKGINQAYINLFSASYDATVQLSAIKFVLQEYKRLDWFYQYVQIASIGYGHKDEAAAIPGLGLPAGQILPFGTLKTVQGFYRTGNKTNEWPFEIEFGVKGGFSGNVVYNGYRYDDDKDSAGDQAYANERWHWTANNGGTLSVVLKLKHGPVTITDLNVNILPYLQQLHSNTSFKHRRLTNAEDNQMNWNNFVKHDEL